MDGCMRYMVGFFLVGVIVSVVAWFTDEYLGFGNVAQYACGWAVAILVFGGYFYFKVKSEE